jgi:hypothetical protein
MSIDITFKTLKDHTKKRNFTLSAKDIRFNQEAFLELIEELGSNSSSTGYGESEDELNGEKQNNVNISDEDIFSWTLLNKTLVEKYGGRERIFNAPAEYISELKNGSILIIINYGPYDFGSSLEQRQKLRAYLKGESDDNKMLNRGKQQPRDKIVKKQDE